MFGINFKSSVRVGPFVGGAGGATATAEPGIAGLPMAATGTKARAARRGNPLRS